MINHGGPDGAFRGAMQTPLPVRRHGFSLLELLVVMTLIGVLAMMSIGRTSSMMTGWRVSRAALMTGDRARAVRLQFATDQVVISAVNSDLGEGFKKIDRL